MKFLALLSTVLLISCAGAPPANDALEQARAAYRAAQAEPEVATYAPAELDAAGRALEDAERARGRDQRVHRAYLAEQRARIARELAQARANDRRQLEARLSEVEQARDVNDRLSAHVRRLQAQVAELQAEETDRGWILTLGSDVLFDVGKATIKPGGRRALANLARVMRQEAERKIVIEASPTTAARRRRTSGSPSAAPRRCATRWCARASRRAASTPAAWGRPIPSPATRSRAAGSSTGASRS